MNWFQSANMDVTEEQLKQFECYYRLLIEENEKYNLTAITERDEVYIKHFLDSILVEKLPFDLQNKKIIDIGTGAGFPAIPLKIMNPSCQMTALDSLNKRIHFLEMICAELGLNQVELIHGRAEDFGQNTKYREVFDFAVSRAVAELRLLLEYVMPFVKVNGYFLAYKSLKTKSELEDAQNAMAKLKCKLVDIQEFILPNDCGKRDIMIIQKIGTIESKYPRKAGIPKKSPL